MPIEYQHAEPARTTPERAFAAIDDLPLTAKWLPDCVSLEKLDPGPTAVGHRLRYVYRQGGKEGEMAGEVVARVPGERLHCMYRDAMFDVSVDMRIERTAEGVVMHHLMAITPKSLAGRLMSPLISLGIGKRTRAAAANLRQLIEADTH